MTKPVVLSKAKWYQLRDKLSQDYPRSVIMVRWKMKEVLGFTERVHEEWIDRLVDNKDMGYGTAYRVTTMHLDFYDEKKRTMFMLKYSEYLQK